MACAIAEEASVDYFVHAERVKMLSNGETREVAEQPRQWGFSNRRPFVFDPQQSALNN